MVVTMRYQRLETMSSAITWKFAAEMNPVTPSTSATPMYLAIDVVLSIEMTSLPVGGRITRIAWGNTTKRSVWPRVMPSDVAASVWPSSTAISPERAISDMYAASFSPNATRAARKGVKVETDEKCRKVTCKKGMPIVMTGKRMAMLNQKINWT